MWWINNISYKYHLFIGFVIRVVLIIYSEYHDRVSEVPYTDIDYRVFTDASRHILNSSSPYDRHTFRYTPLIAVLLLPNVLVHGTFGKCLFAIVDLIVGLLIRTIVLYSRCKYTRDKESSVVDSATAIEDSDTVTHGRVGAKIRKRNVRKPTINQAPLSATTEQNIDHVADNCMLFWIYNPMSIIITTRGNCDSIAAFLVLLTLYLLLCKEKYFLAGLTHGLAIHVRLYPLMYSLSMYMYLSEFSQYATDKRVTTNLQLETKFKSLQSPIDDQRRKTIFKKQYLFYLVPNKHQLSLIFGCTLSLFNLTALFYYLYGQRFLYETYFYHLVRKDTRHNFSVFFYIQYLTASVQNIGFWQKVLSVLPQLVLLVVLSVRYGLNKFTMPFSILTQTIVIVAYNSVLTSQYFVWIIAILPLTLWQFEMSRRTCSIMSIIWIVAQLAWLLPAYLLEFLGKNTFFFIWLQGVSFFCVNMAILGRFIKCYMNKN